jgi:protein translocase SecG subunit
MIHRILSIIQIVLALLLIGSILLQNKGASLGGAFGGEGNVYSTKRGAERAIFIATIVLVVLFAGVALANVLIPR